MRHAYPGSLVTFEGIDGVGKSLQMKMLAESLHTAGFDVCVTKEPGDEKTGSSVGAGIRSLLFDTPGTANLAPGVGDLLFAADHVQNVADIKTRLEAGQVVLSDRYADSQFAYAASRGKKTPDWANSLFREQYGVDPDLILLFIARGVVKQTPYLTFGKLDFWQFQSNEDISWALQRANSRVKQGVTKQEAKAWNKEDDQRMIQRSYVHDLAFKDNVICVHVWETDEPEAIHKFVHNLVLKRIPREVLTKG